MGAIFILLTVICSNVAICKILGPSPDENKENLPILKFTGISKSTINPFLNVTVTTEAVKIANNSSYLTTMEEEDDDDEEPSWGTYIEMLIIISLKELENIESNIRGNYKLMEPDLIEVGKAFNESKNEYEYLMGNKLKKIVESQHLNISTDVWLNLLEVSNNLIEKITNYSLGKANIALSIPTNLHKQTLKDKILRQQIKASSTSIDIKMCNMLAVCREKEVYNDYVVEWLRALLNAKDNVLKDFFNAISVMLDKKILKISSPLRKNIMLASKSSPMEQRDTIDFIDESITNPNLLQLVPDALIKCTLVLIDIFKIFNDNYDLQIDNNVEELDSISNKLTDSTERLNMKDILESVIKNMKSNYNTWPKNKQEKLSELWSEMLFL